MAALPNGPLRTEWRILPEPGSDGAELTNSVDDSADFASVGSPWSDTHAIANEALTNPPIGGIDLRIFCLETQAEMWPEQHEDCYDPAINPDACENGQPRYHAPGPLRIEPGEDKDFVTIADYVREVGRWMESDVVARDLACWWPWSCRMGDGKAVADGCPPRRYNTVDEIWLNVHSPTFPERNRKWTKLEDPRDPRLMKIKARWLPKSLVIAESLRRG
ncbi:hypothetical protein QBC39DRAFT_431845 [Podospora conica]|nr:hypothetical protein QBC39DRAFT_431845 [Schizothecium conicum]